MLVPEIEGDKELWHDAKGGVVGETPDATYA